MSHARGPWKITKSGVRNINGYIVLWPSEPTHYEGQDERYAEELEERAANARLIAAAPGLYESLKVIISDLPSRRDWLNPEIEQLAREALKKVEG